MAEGFKLFTNVALTADDINDYLMKQGRMVFDTTAARDAALAAVLRAGLGAYIKSNDAAEGIGEYNSALVWRKPWNMPWGVQGVHSLTSAYATTGTHTTLQDEGLTLTLAEVVRRRWKFSLILNPYVPGGANAVNYKLLRDGVVMREWTLPVEAMSTSSSHGITLTHTEAIAASAAASVFKVQIRATPTNTSVTSFADAATMRQLVVEDIGPSGAPA